MMEHTSIATPLETPLAPPPRKILVAMSGGVDSSVCAWLLTRAGHDVAGVFMRLGTDCDAGCGSEQDARDAQRVADVLGIPLHVLDLRAEFGPILEYFATEYARCRTPNPCVMCNQRLKFGKLFDFADTLGAEFVATGHYVRVEAGALLRAVDAGKDQSYVLHRVPRERLGRLMFPLGGLRKTEIRRLAQEAGLPVAEKPDSQDVCFIPDGDHARFVRDFYLRKTGAVPDTRGDFVTTSGVVRGPHLGLERYTVGQRKGLGLAFPVPHFVIRLEPDTRRVVLGTHDELARTSLTASDVNWHVDPPAGEFECQVKIRYRTPAVEARVTPTLDRTGAPGIQVRFQAPTFGIAPGQAVVCYDGQRLLGGGWID